MPIRYAGISGGQMLGLGSAGRARAPPQAHAFPTRKRGHCHRRRSRSLLDDLCFIACIHIERIKHHV